MKEKIFFFCLACISLPPGFYTPSKFFFQLQSEVTGKDNGVKEENNPVQRVRVRDPSALGGD